MPSKRRTVFTFQNCYSFLATLRRAAKSAKQTVGVMVEWASAGRTSKRGEAGGVTEVNSPEAVGGR